MMGPGYTDPVRLCPAREGPGSRPTLSAQYVFGPAGGLPDSMLLVRVFGDGIEVDEHYSQDQTAALVKQLRGLGVMGRIVFRTPCG